MARWFVIGNTRLPDAISKCPGFARFRTVLFHRLELVEPLEDRRRSSGATPVCFTIVLKITTPAFRSFAFPFSVESILLFQFFNSFLISFN